MNPIPITRAEYEKKFGVKPVVSTSTLDTTPAPQRITRAQWEEMQKQWNPQSAPSQTPIADIIPHSTYNPDQNGLINIPKAVGNIPHEVGASIENIANVPGAVYNTVTDPNVIANPGASALGFVKGAYNALGAPIVNGLQTLGNTLAGGAFKGIEALTGVKMQNTETQKAWDEKYNNLRDAAQSVQQMLVEHPLATASMAESIPGVKAPVAKTADLVKTGVDTVVKPIIEKIDARTALKRQETLYNIENNYATLRKNMNASSDANASSRARIAEANIWDNVVNTDGKMSTLEKGGAYDQYRKATVDGKESLVRSGLEQEGKTVKLVDIATELKTNIMDSGLEGADLLKAIKGVDQQIKGLSLRADAQGNVPLAKIHDAKVNEYENINYAKDSTPQIRYRKAIARTYKEVVENNSTTDVKKINNELSKYYDDLALIKSLDGRVVKGGKLGKYFAQVSGNMIGGAVGAAVGGPVGMAAGTIVGGEAAGFLKGKAMSRSLGLGGKGVSKNAVLEAARLKVADKIVEAPKALAKSPEITKAEAQIKKNVELQKKAIKDGNFDLVASLKEIYVTLVEKLKVYIKDSIESPKIGLAIKDVTKNVHLDDIQVMKDYIDSVRLKKDLTKPSEQMADKMMERFGISPDTNANLIANKFEKIVQSNESQSKSVGSRKTQYKTTATTAKTAISDTVSKSKDNVNSLIRQVMNDDNLRELAKKEIKIGDITTSINTRLSQWQSEGNNLKQLTEVFKTNLGQEYLNTIKKALPKTVTVYRVGSTEKPYFSVTTDKSVADNIAKYSVKYLDNVNLNQKIETAEINSRDIVGVGDSSEAELIIPKDVWKQANSK